MLEQNVIMQLKYKFDAINDSKVLNESNIKNETLVKNAERRFFKDLKLYSEGKKEFAHITQRIGDLDRQRLAFTSPDSLRTYKEDINRWDPFDK